MKMELKGKIVVKMLDDGDTAEVVERLYGAVQDSYNVVIKNADKIVTGAKQIDLFVPIEEETTTEP